MTADNEAPKNQDAVALAKLGGSKGGHARALALAPERRREIARAAASARWGNSTSHDARQRAEQVRERKHHPLICGLIEVMPREGTAWSAEDRVKWLNFAIACFDLVYSAAPEDFGTLVARLEREQGEQ